MKKKGNWFPRLAKIVLVLAGSLFLVLFILAFTTLPFWAMYSLGTKNSKLTEAPATIIMLGGSGIPSGDGLMRTYYTARLATAQPKANVIIAMPGKISDSISMPRLAFSELILRGVDPHSISYENNGRNTREQALKLSAGKSDSQLNKPITLITSPEHMKRAVLTFRKCGFKKVSGLATFENPLDVDLSFIDKDLKGNKFVPPIGNNLQVRYHFWTQLKYEIVVIREYFGLGYYKMRGWI